MLATALGGGPAGEGHLVGQPATALLLRHACSCLRGMAFGRPRFRRAGLRRGRGGLEVFESLDHITQRRLIGPRVDLDVYIEQTFEHAVDCTRGHRQVQRSQEPIRASASVISAAAPAKDSRTNEPPCTVSKSTPGAMATPVSANSFAQNASESSEYREISA